MRAVLLAALALATPAAAQSQLGFADIGNLFCAAIVSGDTASLRPLLTQGLADLTEGRDVAWHSGTDAPVQCMAVGASGTADIPETVLFMAFPDGKTASDRLALNWVDNQLRIDDVKFDRAGTLRQSLAGQ